MRVLQVSSRSMPSIVLVCLLPWSSSLCVTLVESLKYLSEEIGMMPTSLKTRRSRAVNCNWVAFYTDLRHRVCEIKEGFHVVLNYSLSFDRWCYGSLYFSATNLRIVVDYFKGWEGGYKRFWLFFLLFFYL